MALMVYIPIATAQGITLYDSSNIDAGGNNVTELSTVNPDGVPLTINAATDFGGNNLSGVAKIRGFFDQSQCDEDEAVKTVYANGSYECNSISTTTSVQNLSETLAAGNSAEGYDLNLSGSSITDYFNQQECSQSKAVKRIYPNGSYQCVGINEADISSVAEASGYDRFIEDWSFKRSSYQTFNSFTAHMTFELKRNITGLSARAFNPTEGFEYATTANIWSTTSNGEEADSILYSKSVNSGDRWVNFTEIKLEAGETYRIELEESYYYNFQLNSPSGVYTNVVASDSGMSNYDDSSDIFGFSAFVVEGKSPFVLKTGDVMTGPLSFSKGVEVGTEATEASEKTSTALGAGAAAQEIGSVAIGSGSSSTWLDGVAIGTDSTADGSAVALGVESISQSGGLALGDNSFSGSGSISLGVYSNASAGASDANAISIGDNSNAYGTETVAIGYSSESTAEGAVALGDRSKADEAYTVELGSSSQNYSLNVNGGSIAAGTNTQSGLSSGDINVSDIYYDTLNAKSPVVQCSTGTSWCEVVEPSKQQRYFVKVDNSFDKDRPRETALEVVDFDVSTAEKVEKLKNVERKLGAVIRSVCRRHPEDSVCTS